MTRIVAIAISLAGALLSTTKAEFRLPDTASAQSVSGQFIVHAQRTSVPRSLPAAISTNLNLVRLEPTLVAVSSERIKLLLARELGECTPWRGKIYLVLYPAEEPGGQVTIAPQRFREGWQYRVDLPDLIDRPGYVRTLVHALLLEIANRNAGGHSAEIPLWLTEGFTRQLLASGETEVILTPPTPAANGVSFTATAVDRRKEPPLSAAHQILSTNAALTFEQLSWPLPEHLAGTAGEVFSSSSQLLVNSLLQLEEGPRCLRAMLASLPDFYNWQLAFLHAFGNYFRRPLDTEKWWALQVVHFTARDLGQGWSLEDSLQKLSEALGCAVQLRTGTNELPSGAKINLQTVIRDWDQGRQLETLLAKRHELELLGVLSPPRLAPLIQEYYQTLGDYLQKRDWKSGGPLFGKRLSLPPIVEETLKKLDALDTQRQTLRSSPGETPTQARAQR